jgi:DNA repair protein RadA/Sms
MHRLDPADMTCRRDCKRRWIGGSNSPARIWIANILLLQALFFVPLTVSGFYLSASPCRWHSCSLNRITQNGLLASRDFHSDNDDDNEEDDDDDYISDVDISSFKPPKEIVSFGLNRGRSSPSIRKAMGTSGSSQTSVHVCTNCGCETVKWHGRCPTCREWNTLQEFAVARERKASPSTASLFNRPIGAAPRPPSSWVGDLGLQNPRGFINQPIRITDVIDKDGGQNLKNQRILIPDDEELTTVLGGGIMKGSICLLGGSPGVGKSTLLLQTAASVASSRTLRGPVWYVSGEETAEQIAARAQRLQLIQPELWLLSETHVDTLAEQVVTLVESDARNTSLALYKTLPPSLLIVDSIQTMICDAGGSSAAGGITQMRECVGLLLRLAKSTGIPILLVGHVTKSGDVAGPRTVEHMVDAVLYLEGLEGGGTGELMNLRMLRTSKNRFGSSDEVGVYEMTAGRLLPVSDPSSLLLSHRLNTEDSEGCAITVAVEGIRAMTVEIQALVTPASGGPGQGSKRTLNGVAYSRLALLLGVLHKRCGMFFARQDVYVNVVGSVRLDRSRGEGGSSSDLTVAVALVSSLMSIPVRSDTAFVGEVGLLGELRPVAAIDKRIQEARRMGFSRIITPASYSRSQSRAKTSKAPGDKSASRVQGIEVLQCSTLLAAINEGLVTALPKRRSLKPMSTTFQKTAPGSLNELNLNESFTGELYDDDDSVYM